MGALISASVTAGSIFRSSESVVIMSGGLFIHELTAEVAAQWLPVIQKIAEGNKA